MARVWPSGKGGNLGCISQHNIVKFGVSGRRSVVLEIPLQKMLLR